MKSSTRDRVKGKTKEIKGATQQTLGAARGDPKQEAKGLVDRAAGRFQKKTGEIKKSMGR